MSRGAKVRGARGALNFAEQCDAAPTIEQVRDLLFRGAADLGFAYVACCSHVDPLRPPAGAVSIINYPADWLKRFSTLDYARFDPVFQAARGRLRPFLWRDVLKGASLTRAQTLILAEAASFGLNDGLTVPIHSPGALPASCSLVPGPGGVDPLDYPNVQWMAVYAHEAARRLSLHQNPGRDPPRLTLRERQCLELAGCGKSDWAIGEILGLHKRTVHNTLERAKQRYGVATRVQAVVRALFDGQIRLEDLSN